MIMICNWNPQEEARIRHEPMHTAKICIFCDHSTEMHIGVKQCIACVLVTMQEVLTGEL